MLYRRQWYGSRFFIFVNKKSNFNNLNYIDLCCIDLWSQIETRKLIITKNYFIKIVLAPKNCVAQFTDGNSFRLHSIAVLRIRSKGIWKRGVCSASAVAQFTNRIFSDNSKESRNFRYQTRVGFHTHAKCFQSSELKQLAIPSI